jgi:hypothetical protein
VTNILLSTLFFIPFFQVSYLEMSFEGVFHRMIDPNLILGSFYFNTSHTADIPHVFGSRDVDMDVVGLLLFPAGHGKYLPPAPQVDGDEDDPDTSEGCSSSHRHR